MNSILSHKRIQEPGGLRSSAQPQMRRESSLGSIGWLLAGAFAGSVLTLVLDPISGRRRRHYLRDKAIRLKNESLSYSEKKALDLKNRIQGIKAKLTHSRAAEGFIDDDRLVARVRSAFGRVVRHPKSIHVEADEGEVVLTGPILEGEVEPLLAVVKSVEGVTHVINNLEVHRSNFNVSGLQGDGKQYQR